MPALEELLKRTPSPLFFSRPFLCFLLFTHTHSLSFSLSRSLLYLFLFAHSPILSLSFHLFAFRHSKISFLLRSSRPRPLVHAESSVFPPLSCFSRFVEELRDAGQTLEPTGAKTKDGVGRKGTVDASFSLSPPLSRSLSLSSPPCHVPCEREKDEDRRRRRSEGDG